jgi:hypothetical protein
MKVRNLVFGMLLAGLAMAADVTGKWTASAPGRGGQTREVTYDLKAEGNTLTGTMTGFRGQDLTITDGKIDGDNISFKTKMEFNGNEMIMNYKGVVSGDEIKFTQEREGGSGRAREFTAKRAK